MLPSAIRRASPATPIRPQALYNPYVQYNALQPRRSLSRRGKFVSGRSFVAGCRETGVRDAVRLLAPALLWLVLTGCGQEAAIAPTPQEPTQAPDAGRIESARPGAPTPSLSLVEQHAIKIAEQFLSGPNERTRPPSGQGAVRICPANAMFLDQESNEASAIAGTPTLIFGPSRLMDGSILMWFDEPIRPSNGKPLVLRITIQLAPGGQCVREYSERMEDIQGR